MSLSAPEIDERTFQDLVDEAKRLIPTYCPEWTNHNLSDPGVALIELFAWMSEIILYRLNQMPDRFFTKFLELVGIRPFSASAARTEVTFWLTSPEAEGVVIPAGTEVTTQPIAGASHIVFSTIDELSIVQPHLVAAVTGTADDDTRFIDVWDSVRFEMEGVACFASDPIQPGDALYLGFENPLAGNVVRLDLGATIEGIGIDPDHPPLRWEVWDGDGWVPCDLVRDTTGGLNRDGSVTLVVPLKHVPLTLGQRREHWLRVVLIEPLPGRPGYETSPVIRGIEASSVGGTVTAEHSHAVDEEFLGRSNGEAGQAFTVRHTPVLSRRPDETVIVRGRDGDERWTEVGDFAASGPNDRHFTWDSGTGTIAFGPRIRLADGSVRQHGAVPGDGSEIAVTGYRHGGGVAGNVGADTLTSLQTAVPYIARVTNRRPAFGGVDPETIDNAKLRGPMTLRTGQRAVTAGDYERLTLEAAPAVARSRCLPPLGAAMPVRVLVVPALRKHASEMVLDDFALPDHLVATIASYLDDRRVLGTSVEVATPYYQGVTVAALIKAVAGRPVTVVRQRVLDALYAHVNPLTGGLDGSGWPFDADLNAANLFELIDAVDGVERVDDVLLFEYDLRTGRRVGPGRDVLRLADNSLFLSAHHRVVTR